MLKYNLYKILSYSFIILQLLLVFIDECDGQSRRRSGRQRTQQGKRRSRRNDDIVPNLTYLWIIIAMVFLPPILYFIYNVSIILLFVSLLSLTIILTIINQYLGIT